MTDSSTRADFFSPPHSVARRQSEDIALSIHQYVTGVDERSQHRHIPDDAFTQNHSVCGKAAK
ncbi:MAG: hypothetical protein RR510_13100 [Morganella sp. (in: enterobacteria)]